MAKAITVDGTTEASNATSPLFGAVVTQPVIVTVNHAAKAFAKDER